MNLKVFIFFYYCDVYMLPTQILTKMKIKRLKKIVAIGQDYSSLISKLALVGSFPHLEMFGGSVGGGGGLDSMNHFQISRKLCGD